MGLFYGIVTGDTAFMDAIVVTTSELLEQPALSLTHPSGAQATVLLYGGHLVSYRTAGGDELLYLSPQATAANGKAVRGGVPVIFPSFDRRGPEPGVPRHGFARTQPFERGETLADGVELLLRDDETTRAVFPHGFALKLRISLAAEAVCMGVVIENRAERAFSLTAALHTYLRVSDVGQVVVRGLEGHRYEDKVRGGEQAEERAPELQIVGEVDRIYSDVQSMTLRDGERTLRVVQRGFPDAVVWNPGPDLAAGMADLPDDGYRNMLCIEAAAALQPVFLRPAEAFYGEQRIIVGKAVSPHAV